MPGHRAAGKRLDDILAQFPLAVLEVVEVIFQKRKLVRAEDSASGACSARRDLTEDREVLAAFDDLIAGIGFEQRTNPLGRCPGRLRRGDERERPKLEQRCESATDSAIAYEHRPIPPF